MSSLKSVFFLLAAGPLFLFLPVLLELSSLTERSSGATAYYIAEHCFSHVAVHQEDILVSFDVSLFTKVPVDKSLNYILEIFTKDLVDIFRACLSTSYFMWNGNFYKQIDGLAMGSPFSPVIANFFMEPFEKLMFELSRLKPKVWLRYVDDTFVAWNQGEGKLQLFLQHINSKNKNIQFTMEKEENGLLPFLDHWYKERGTDLGTKSTENRHIPTDICTRNPIITRAKKEEL